MLLRLSLGPSGPSRAIAERDARSDVRAYKNVKDRSRIFTRDPHQILDQTVTSAAKGAATQNTCPYALHRSAGDRIVGIGKGVVLPPNSPEVIRMRIAKNGSGSPTSPRFLETHLRFEVTTRREKVKRTLGARVVVGAESRG